MPASYVPAAISATRTNRPSEQNNSYAGRHPKPSGVRVVFDRAPGILLAISGPLFLALAGPFMPVAGALSAVLFGAARMWWGFLLWTRGPGHPRTQVPRTGATSENPQL